MRRLTWSVGVAALLGSGVAWATGGAGDLDASFGGGDGVAVAPVNKFTVRNVAVDASGRTVAVGNDQASTIVRWGVARFATDGTLDPTFVGGSGYKTFFGTVGSNRAKGLAIDGNGRIVVGGQATWQVSTGKKLTTKVGFGLLRLLSDGTPDASFGAGGTMLTEFSTGGINPDVASVVVHADDGKVVAAGFSGSYAALARYTDSGALDPTFGGGAGKVTLSLGTSEPYIIAMQRDAAGRYVFVTPGRSSIPSLLVRVLPNGTLDGSFGIRNMTTMLASLGTLFTAYHLQVTSDGRILVAGTIRNGPDSTFNDAVVARFDASGNLDTTFGSAGVASAHLPGGDAAKSVAIQADGRIVLVSDWPDFDLSPARMVFVTTRFLADGQLDPTYGSAGVGQIADSGTGSQLYAATLDPSGRVVAGGIVVGGLQIVPMLARWLP